MINLNVLFLCRKNDKYSTLCKNYLIKKFNKVKIIQTNQSNKILLPKWKGDLILLFRSKIILKKDIIKKARIGCVNFHPSTPKYRGVGCINYAIYNNDKHFGCTAHLIENNKIDSGKILNVRKFRLLKNISLSNLLKKTHKNLYLQFKHVVPNVINKKSINKLIKKTKKETWSKIYSNKQKLDNFHEINFNEKNLKNKIRATYLNNKYSPYYFINNKKKKLTQDKIKELIKS